MDEPVSKDPVDSPPAVAPTIPSAVRINTGNATFLWGLIALSLMVILLVRGGTRKTNPTSTESFSSGGAEVSIPPSSLPPPPLQAVLSSMPPMSLESIPGPSLRDIRRKSPVLIYNAVTGPSGTSSTDPAAPTVPLPPGFRPTAAASSRSTSLGDREYIIAQGKLIDAVLETAINSDHPGLLRALVSQDIYGDSGRTLLLPRGSRLIGQYDAGVTQGQNRVFVLWQRVIRPDGVDITLDSGGTDALGQAGLEGKVNRHFWTMFGAATLLSIIGASAATLGVQSGDTPNSLSSYRSMVAQGFNEASGSVLGVFVRIKPTIQVRQGMTVKVFVARDLYFDAALVSANRIQVIP